MTGKSFGLLLVFLNDEYLMSNYLWDTIGSHMVCHVGFIAYGFVPGIQLESV